MLKKSAADAHGEQLRCSAFNIARRSGRSTFTDPLSAIHHLQSAIEWARQDSNLGPRDYESPALTAELQARSVS